MNLLWIFRAIFIVVILSVLFVNISTIEITKEVNSASFWTVSFSGVGMAVFVFLLELFTPKKKLSSLAGVFFGLLVGVLISGALAPIVDMMAQSYNTTLIPEAVYGIKWLMGICICYLVISIIMRVSMTIIVSQ